MYPDATPAEINAAAELSFQAFLKYRALNLRQRAEFMKAIAGELKATEDELVQTAAAETNLDATRLKGELGRTIFQMVSYGQACEQGAWLEIRIDTADAQRTPPKVDLRKMLVPLGPVVVFGASNFPFAYSTAGGDTACALAAGCPVIIKAHPAHAGTSEKVAAAVKAAARKCQLPDGIFTHLHGAAFEVGKALVEHPLVRAVGFTGSLGGGRALFDIANRRPVPIPVFSEMGSINPVFILGAPLKENPEYWASQYAASITQGGGQFCTNPGLLIGIDGADLDRFKQLLAKNIEAVKPVKMLHPGIAQSFHVKRAAALQQDGVQLVTTSSKGGPADETIPTLATVSADQFLKNPLLHQEVFGPYSILVACKDLGQMLEVAQKLEGQLTTSLIASADEVKHCQDLVAALQSICGRLVFNGVPTGVEVALAMQHGGPYPATTDSRFTAVGADGIKRFARPVCYQNWPDELLPPELKNGNPLKIWRTVNNALTDQAI